MTKQNTNSKKGFTIIEVVLVLAIAGLIFLMVFIAYPALRRSQADTQRREDMSRALSQLTSYIANNRIPPKDATKFNDFFLNYLTYTKEGFKDPDGLYYAPKYIGDCAGASEGATCDNGKPAANQDFNAQIADYSFKWTVNATTATAEKAHPVYYYTKAKCKEGEDWAVKANGSKEVAILYKLEGGGYYCGSNSN